MSFGTRKVADGNSTFVISSIDFWLLRPLRFKGPHYCPKCEIHALYMYFPFMLVIIKYNDRYQDDFLITINLGHLDEEQCIFFKWPHLKEQMLSAKIEFPEYVDS